MNGWGGEQLVADINKTIKDLDEQIAWIQDNDFHKFPGWGHTVLAMKDALALLKEQQPKKGEWLKDYTYRKDHPRNYCSVCNMTGGFRTDYCPNCGAYMRKDGEHE